MAHRTSIATKARTLWPAAVQLARRASQAIGLRAQRGSIAMQALTSVFGIGRQKALQICAQCGISGELKVGELTRYQLDQINQFIGIHYTTDSELRRTIQNDIQRCISIACYRGFRHHAGLPVRGQRTHTNAKTSRRLLLQSNRTPRPAAQSTGS